MDTTKDYYAILGVLRSAEVETIQAVCRALSKKYHPDVSRIEATVFRFDRHKRRDSHIQISLWRI